MHDPLSGPFTPDTARVIGQLLLIVFLLGLLFLGGVVALTLGLSSQQGKVSDGEAHGERPHHDPSEFKHLELVPEELPEGQRLQETASRERKAS